MKTDVHAMNPTELLALFETLDCPTIAEMNGEYKGEMLAQVNAFSRFSNSLVTDNPLLFGHWLCKAFRPVDATSGRGYNSLRHFGRIRREAPMVTVIAPSRRDGRPAYQLVYRAYHSVCGTMHMIDEVRRLDQGRYLCFGTWGFADPMQRTPLPFLLTGPVAPYWGDVGKPRKGFQVESEIPASSGERRPASASPGRQFPDGESRRQLEGSRGP